MAVKLVIPAATDAGVQNLEPTVETKPQLPSHLIDPNDPRFRIYRDLEIWLLEGQLTPSNIPLLNNIKGMYDGSLGFEYHELVTLGLYPIPQNPNTEESMNIACALKSKALHIPAFLAALTVFHAACEQKFNQVVEIKNATRAEIEGPDSDMNALIQLSLE